MLQKFKKTKSYSTQKGEKDKTACFSNKQLKNTDYYKPVLNL